MTKYICDKCGKETNGFRSVWHELTLETIENGIQSVGHYGYLTYCKKCTEKIKDAFSIK